MNHAELLCQPKQTFRVPNEKISGRIQAVPKLFNQTLLLGLVKINHHVAAEDNVVAARQEFRFQVVKVEGDERFQLWFDLLLIASFFEITDEACAIHRFPLLIGVCSLLPDM